MFLGLGSSCRRVETPFGLEPRLRPEVRQVGVNPHSPPANVAPCSPSSSYIKILQTEPVQNPANTSLRGL